MKKNFYFLFQPKDEILLKKRQLPYMSTTKQNDVSGL